MRTPNFYQLFIYFNQAEISVFNKKIIGRFEYYVVSFANI